MAITASGLFVATFVDIFDATQLAWDPASDTQKIALFQDAGTPNFDTDTSYNSGTPWTSASETSGGSWSAGGYSLVSPAVTAVGSGGQLKFDATDVSQASSTITSAIAGLVYDDTLAGDNVVCLIKFSSAASCTAGTFSITFDSTGIFVLDLA